MTRSSTPAAERMRRHRNLGRRGMRTVRIRVTHARIDALIAKRYLEADKRADVNAVQAAIRAFISDKLGAPTSSAGQHKPVDD